MTKIKQLSSLPAKIFDLEYGIHVVLVDHVHSIVRLKVDHAIESSFDQRYLVKPLHDTSTSQP